MEELEKLRHIIDHWIDHNEEHVRTYNEWAERADAFNRPELSDIMRQIAFETEKLDGLFKLAREKSG